MSLDWANERYVRVYTRDTTTWKLCDWRARTVLLHLFRKVDRSGVLDVGDDGVAGLAAVLELPLEEIVEPGIAQLVKRGTVEHGNGAYVIPNFIEAQGNVSSTYVVRAGSTGPVKIGRSKDPVNRIAELQTACAEQLVLLHLIPFDIEAELHRRLSPWRVRGEWFSAECMAALAAALRDLSEKGDVL